MLIKIFTKNEWMNEWMNEWIKYRWMNSHKCHTGPAEPPGNQCNGEMNQTTLLCRHRVWWFDPQHALSHTIESITIHCGRHIQMVLGGRQTSAHISSPWLWKGVYATSQSGRYTLSYPMGRYICMYWTNFNTCTHTATILFLDHKKLFGSSRI